MTDEMNRASRTISVRRDGTALVSINALVSRGLRESGTLAALGCDVWLAERDSVYAVEDEDVRAGALPHLIGEEIATFIDEDATATTLTGTDVTPAPKAFNPELGTLVAKYAAGKIKEGVYRFADFVETFVERFGEEMTRTHLARYIESAWNIVKRYDQKGRLDATRPVADILKEIGKTPDGDADETREVDAEEKQESTTKSRQSREHESQLNPRKIAATVELIKAAVEHGISEFAAFVEFVAEEFGREKTLAIAGYLESAWRVLGQRSDFQHIDAAGKVADVLKCYRDGKDQEADGEAGVRGNFGMDCRDGASEGNNATTDDESFLGLGVASEGLGKDNRKPDPKLLKLGYEAAVASIDAGVTTFAAFVETVYSEVPDLIDQLAPYLESAWRVAHERYPKKVGPAGKVADVLKVIRDATSQEADEEARMCGRERVDDGARTPEGVQAESA